MAPVLKAYEKEVSISEKRKGKRKVGDLDEDGQDGVSNRSLKKRNKQRVLLLSSRGITHRMRHFMNDLEALLPHVKKGVCIHSWGPHFLSVNADKRAKRWSPRFEARLEEPPSPAARTRGFTFVQQHALL